MPIFDFIFGILKYADTSYFAVGLISLVWIGFSYRWGIRLNYLLYASYIVNTFVKNIFQWPRPPSDTLFDTYGFPSGGAQSAMIYGLLLLYYWKNKYVWPIAISVIILLSYTRIYVLAHYPIDVFGGWVIGLCLFYLFHKTVLPIEKHLQSKGLLYSFIVGTAIPALLFLAPDRHYHNFDMLVLGLGICLSLRHNLYLPPPKTIWLGLGRALFAWLGIAILFVLFSKPLLSLCVALWISLFASPIITAADLFFRRFRKFL